MQATYRVVEASMPMFVDAVLCEGESWLFGSFWGGETAMQEFFARLTLPDHEFGLSEFTLESPAGEMRRIRAGRVADFTKLTGRTPPSTVLGSICHVWMFDPKLRKLNHGSGEAYLLGVKRGAQDWCEAVWSVAKELSQLPLQDHWQGPIMALLEDQGWVVALEGLGIDGLKIALPSEAFCEEVKRLLRGGLLPLQPGAALKEINSITSSATVQHSMF